MIYNKPKISIISINYNNRDGLKDTIKSVINQSFRDFEYIIIDGGSEDGSSTLIEEYKNHFSFSISERDYGIYNAMNKGIYHATGDYLLFLNSGDSLIADTILEDVVAHGLTHDLVFGDLLFFARDREWEWKMPDNLRFSYFFKFSIAHPSTFIKRELFEYGGTFDESLKIVSDWKFFLNSIFKYSCTYKHFSKIISRYSFDGISSKPENLLLIEKERKLVLEREFPLFFQDYEDFFRLRDDHKRIKYFLAIRKFAKDIFNSK